MAETLGSTTALLAMEVPEPDKSAGGRPQPHDLRVSLNLAATAKSLVISKLHYNAKAAPTWVLTSANLCDRARGRKKYLRGNLSSVYAAAVRPRFRSRPTTKNAVWAMLRASFSAIESTALFCTQVTSAVVPTGRVL